MSLILNNNIKTSPSSVYLGEDMLWGTSDVTPPTPPTPTYPADNEVRFTFSDGTSRTVQYNLNEATVALIIDPTFDDDWYGGFWEEHYNSSNPYGSWVNDAVKIEVGDGFDSCFWVKDEEEYITFESLSSITFGSNIGNGSNSYFSDMVNIPGWSDVAIRELTFRGGYLVDFTRNDAIFGGNSPADSLRSSVTSVTFDGSAIPSSQCSGYTALLSLTVGSGVTIVNIRAFTSCSSLNTIFAYPTEPPRLGTRAFYHTGQDGTLYVPAGTTYDYGIWTGTQKLQNWTISDIL